MLAYLVGHAALGVASVISSEAIASATTGKRMKKSFPFVQLAETQVEQARPVAIHQDHPQAREGPEQPGQRFQMEMPIDQKLRAAELWRQIILAPKALCGAREDGLGVGAVTPQVLRQTDNAVNIGARRLAFIFARTRALALQPP